MLGSVLFTDSFSSTYTATMPPVSTVVTFDPARGFCCFEKSATDTIFIRFPFVFALGVGFGVGILCGAFNL